MIIYLTLLYEDNGFNVRLIGVNVQRPYDDPGAECLPFHYYFSELAERNDNTSADPNSLSIQAKPNDPSLNGRLHRVRSAAASLTLRKASSYGLSTD
ncbi:unnamed protein product [Heligmosomoides polygyrus]|uniref:Uncharacterized protein n=1 Tax=Heligmosomoides polygyrus TaxID=6339 RepID=A0A183FH63_HELPZ|nr:unnamed protein product [Heligmosomoides polygyrus]